MYLTTITAKQQKKKEKLFTIERVFIIAQRHKSVNKTRNIQEKSGESYSFFIISIIKMNNL